MYCPTSKFMYAIFVYPSPHLLYVASKLDTDNLKYLESYNVKLGKIQNSVSI